MSTINGTAGNDTLVGDKFPFHLPPLFNNADTINGFDGNDILRGLSQNDTLNGGNGNDQLFGGSGNDILRGNNGVDFLDGGTGADNMNGGDQNDTYIVDNVGDVTAESFNDALGGVDTVQSSAAFHTIGFGIENLTLTGVGNISGTGNANANIINGNSGNNTLSGLSGNDTINAFAGNDSLFGGDGNDTLRGGTGTDFLNGGAGADNMNGGDQNDTYIVDNVGDVTAESFNDALGGVDTVQSSAAFHTIGFGIENLTLTGVGNISGTGNANANIINGNSGNNTLSGLSGNDTINGFAGNDSLFGDSGNDILTGGLGRDFLSGGLGNDRFDYNSTSESPTGALNRDVISGFTGNGAFVGDQIDLRDIDANTTFLSFGNQAFSYIGGAAFSNVLGIYTPGQLRYSGGVLQGNTDFDGAAEIEIALVPAPASLYVNSATPLTTDILL
ncbi:MAG: calcium-binding protein [Nitrospira sp.]|nr:calcium-binding protein [Nitrospira sp.]